MTVSVDADLRIREYAGDNSANPRAVPFKFLANDDLKVTRTNVDGSETVLTRGTHYSVAGAGNPNGGSVTPLAPIANGTIWRIEGDMSLEQPTDYTAGDDFPAESHERGLDRSMIAHQEARRDISDILLRALIWPRGEAPGALPAVGQRANRFPFFGPLGELLMSNGVGVDAGFRDDMLEYGALLSGFSHDMVAAPGTIADKLKRFISITDAPYNAKCDATWDGTTLTGTDDSDAWDAALADIAAAGGGKLWVPGKSRCNRTIAATIDGLTIVGDVGRKSQMLVGHDGIGLDIDAALNNLPNGKFCTQGFGIVYANGNTLDGNGFPTEDAVGTALKLTNVYGSTFIDLFIEGFDKSHILHDSAILTFIGFTDRNCWTGRQFTGYTNTVQYIGGVCNNSSIDTHHDEVKSIDFYGVDVEAASRTLQIGTGTHFVGCRLERLHINRPDWFEWMRIYGDDNLIDRTTKLFWDGSALAGDGPQEFFIVIEGKNNELHFTYVYNHENVLRLTSTAENNDIHWSARFLDFEHTGGNAGYRFSRRFYIDSGVGNRFHYKSRLARVETTGADALRADGRLNTYLRNSVLGNMTITAASLTVAASDVAGPLGVAAGNENVRKVTLAAGATKRATIDPGVVADGNTIYTLACYVRLASGGVQATRVRIGIGDGNFTDIYPTDGADIWHRVVVFHKAANGTDVKFMVEAEGDIGDVFYIGFPSLAAGECPAFIDRTHAAVTNTQTTATSFDSDSLRYPGREERGTFVPGLSIGGTPQAGLATTGSYIRIGNMVDVQAFIALTGAPAGAGGAIITGLPYDVSAIADYGSVPFDLVPVNITYTGQMSAMTTPGTKTAELYQTTEAGARSALTHANFANNSYFYFHMRYSV